MRLPVGCSKKSRTPTLTCSCSHSMWGRFHLVPIRTLGRLTMIASRRLMERSCRPAGSPPLLSVVVAHLIMMRLATRVQDLHRLRVGGWEGG